MNTYRLESTDAIQHCDVQGHTRPWFSWTVDGRVVSTSTMKQSGTTTEFLYESYAEVIAYKIANKLGIDNVKYKLCTIVIDDRITTVGYECKEFKPEGLIEVTIRHLMNSGRIPELNELGGIKNYALLLRSLNEVGVNLRKYVDSMVIMDSIMLNEGRTFDKMTMFMNSKGELTEAPLRFNGHGLLCGSDTGRLMYSNEITRCMLCMPFGDDFDKELWLLRECPVEIEKLYILKGYIRGIVKSMFDQGLPKKRADFMVDALQNRVNKVIRQFEMRGR